MGHRILPIRRWASAAIGAALLTTSLVTGASAANAGLSFDGYVNVTPGTVPGSGTVSITSGDGASGAYSVVTFSDQRCTGQGGSYLHPNTTASITIGSSTYTAPDVTQWTRAQSNGYHFDNVTCKDAAGNTLSGVAVSVTEYSLTWTADYSCRPAGTAVSASIAFSGTPSNWVYGSPTTIPANGQLPASCFGSPAILVSPGSGAAGSLFGVSGSNYPKGAVSVQFDSTDVADLTVGVDGKFYTPVTVPAGASAGAHTVTVSSPNTSKKTATFTVTAPAPAPKPTLGLSARSGKTGTAFTATGSHYTPGEAVTLEFDSAVLGTVKAGADGTFSFNATVPADATAGGHSVMAAVEGTGTQSAQFTVVADQGPSPSPSPSSSSNSGEGSGTGTAAGNAETGAGSGGAAISLQQSGTPGTAASGSNSLTAGTSAAAAPGTSRGLAVQTAVAAGSASTDRTALAGWSVLTGLLGLGFGAIAVRQLRRPRRRA
ncbi:hypothetical protein [Sinomonas soli]